MPRGAGLVVPIVLFPCLAAAAAAAEPATLQSNLAAMLQALQRPEVTAVVDAPPRLSIGRATIEPATGSKLLVLSAQGRACGWVLDGPARWSYRVEDRFSIPVAEQNLKHVAELAPGRDDAALVVTGTLRGAAVWGWNLELPAASASAPPGSELPAWLLDRLGWRYDDNPERDLLSYAWNSDNGYRWATLRGATDDFMLDVDPRPSVRLETLMRWRRVVSETSAYRGRVSGETLAAQPTSGDWWEPPTPEFATADTVLSLASEGATRVTVHARLQVRSLRDGLRLLPMGLIRNFVDGARNKHEFTVTAVTVDAQPAAFLHRAPGHLLMELPHSLDKGQQATVEMSGEGDIAVRPQGDAYWILGRRAWYPQPRWTGIESSSFRIDATSQPPLVPLASGRQLAEGRRRRTSSRAWTDP